MSTYLSYRRRLSEPEKPVRRYAESEKPEPRFQWRLRVHSLMMDDSDSAPSLSDRKAQRFDSKRGSGGKRSQRKEDASDDDKEDTATAEAYRNRRDRFTRTKSDSHLKLRVRFSKVLDTSVSLDDDDDYDVDSDQEFRRLRSSRDSGIDTLDDNRSSEDADQPKRRRDHSKSPQEKGAGSGVESLDSQDDSDEREGAVGGAVPRQDAVEVDEGVKDVSRGAIPKRYPSSSLSRWDRSKGSVEEGTPERRVPEQPVASSSVAVPSDDKEAIPDSKGHSHFETSSKGSEHPAAEVQDQATGVSPKSPSHVQRPNSPSHLSLRQEDPRSGLSSENSDRKRMQSISDSDRQDSEDKGEIEDIDAIIERIIAEEESMLEGKESNPSLITSSPERLGDEEVSKLKHDLKNIRDSVDDDKDEVENGIKIVRNTSQDKQQSSSLPSYQSVSDQSLIKTVMPYSSSCPSSHKGMDRDDVDDDDEDDEFDDGWAYLPVILLEDVFTLLTPKERHQASQVCQQWYDLFYSPRVWETFILLERTLTKKRFNLYKGYQRELCPGKTQLCFRRVGSFFKRIVVTPITDYFNLYEFLRILAAFLEYQEDHGLAAMPLLHTFDFTFACASRGDGGMIVHGTGGQILEMIKQLLIRMSNLKHLKLNQLLIDVMEVTGLFDAIGNCFSECLRSLEMLNVTKIPFALTDLARFRNLMKLTVSPQHLNEEVLLLLAGLHLLQLHILQDPYTCECEPVSYEAWKLMREMAPWLQVYLEVSGLTRENLLIQPRAPVHGVFLRTPYSLLTNDLVMSLVEHYSKTLRYFVQERLPRVHGPRGFESRCDSSLLFLVRRCRALHTLVVRERISTFTLILLATEGRCLSTLLVRKNGLIKRCDWPRCGEWTKEFYSRLRAISLDYDKCTDEVCTLLRRRWKPLTDKQFMRLKIVPRSEMF